MTAPAKASGFIRMGLMATAFVTLTVVLLLFQPGAPRNAAYQEPRVTDVTRAAPQLEALNTSATTSEPQSAPASVRDLTFDAISNLKSATTGEAPAPGQPGSFLHSVVKRSIASQGTVETAPQPLTPSASTSANLQPVKSVAPTYFVRPGDTLTSIAKEVYGDVAMASALFTHNDHLLPQPHSLRAGMIIDLPSR